MVDFSVQRLNMVESQVRPSELTDRRIARGMMAVPREAFLPAALHGVAYSDSELPLDRIEGAGGGRRMLAARTVAMMIQALEVGDGLGGQFHDPAAENGVLVGAANLEGINAPTGKGPCRVNRTGSILLQKRAGRGSASLAPPPVRIERLLQRQLAGTRQAGEPIADHQPL